MKNVLVVAPHPDDEILGCGGTMLRHVHDGDRVYVCIVTHAEPPIYPKDASLPIQKDARRCHQWMGVEDTFFLDFPAVMLEKVDRYKINNALLDLIMKIKPDVVYLPHYGDMQKDHQVVAESCMVVLRPKYINYPIKIYGYETLSETAWNSPTIQNEFMPNVFVNISDYLEGKIDALKFFQSQLAEFPSARSLKAIEALARYRGALMHVGAAEAFMLLREVR